MLFGPLMAATWTLIGVVGDDENRHLCVVFVDEARLNVRFLFEFAFDAFLADFVLLVSEFAGRAAKVSAE